MRKVILHIIIIFTAFNTVTANQFSRLPLLVVHYMEHWERDHNVTLATFFDMHYLGHDIKDHDDDKDKQLPLKSFSPFSIFNCTAPANADFILAQSETYPPAKLKHYTRDNFYLTQVLSSLFRPPQITA